MIRLRTLWVVMATLLALGIFGWGRDLPWSLATVVAMAIGALVYTTLGTIARLRAELDTGRTDSAPLSQQAFGGGRSAAAPRSLWGRGLTGGAVPAVRRPVFGNSPGKDDDRPQQQQMDGSGENEAGEQ